MIFVSPSQHGDGERPAWPILVALFSVAVFAGLAFYRRNGGEFTIEGFGSRAAMRIAASLGISLVVAVGMVAVGRRLRRATGSSVEDRLTSIEDDIGELRRVMDAQLDAMSRKVDEATRAVSARREPPD